MKQKVSFAAQAMPNPSPDNKDQYNFTFKVGMETPEPQQQPSVPITTDPRKKEPLLDITSQHKTQPMNKVSSRQQHPLAGLQI